MGQPTRLKIIFKVRTFEVGPPDFPNATPVSLPFSFAVAAAAAAAAAVAVAAAAAAR